MKKSNDTIGNRTRDLPACSAVPQPNAPPRAPYLKRTKFKLSKHYMKNIKIMPLLRCEVMYSGKQVAIFWKNHLAPWGCRQEVPPFSITSL